MSSASDEPLGTPDIPERFRKPQESTLESQNEESPLPPWRKFVAQAFFDTFVIDEFIELWLDNLESSCRARREDDLVKLSKAMRRLYRQCCGKRVKDFVETIRCWTLLPPAPYFQHQDCTPDQRSRPDFVWSSHAWHHTRDMNPYKMLQLKRQDQFRQSIMMLLEDLMDCPEGSLKLIAIANRPSAMLVTKLIGHWSRFIAALRLDLAGLHLIPSQIVRFIVGAVHSERMTFAFDQYDEKPKNSLRLPTAVQAFPEVNWYEANKSTMLIHWPSTAPTFEFDFQAYVWTQHRGLPRRRFATITHIAETCLNETNSSLVDLVEHNPHNDVVKNHAKDAIFSRLYIIFDSVESLEHFTYMRHSSQVYGHLQEKPPGKWSSESEMIYSVLAVFHVVNLEIAHFLKDSYDQVEQMEIRCRKSPSISKMRFVLHLQDCCEDARNSIQTIDKLLRSFHRQTLERGKSAPFWNACLTIDERFRKIEQRSKSLSTELGQLSKDVKKLKVTIQEQLALTQGHRNFLITIVAALYLPLSFTTSFFGMNMATTDSFGPDGFSNWTTSWLQGLDVQTSNSTQAIISTIESSGSRSWPWKAFGLMAGLLILTIPLSLVAGALLRWLIRTVSDTTKYWQALWLPLVVTFLYFAVPGFAYYVWVLIFGRFLWPRFKRFLWAHNRAHDRK